MSVLEPCGAGSPGQSSCNPTPLHCSNRRPVQALGIDGHALRHLVQRLSCIRMVGAVAGSQPTQSGVSCLGDTARAPWCCPSGFGSCWLILNGCKSTRPGCSGHAKHAASLDWRVWAVPERMGHGALGLLWSKAVSWLLGCGCSAQEVRWPCCVEIRNERSPADMLVMSARSRAAARVQSPALPCANAQAACPCQPRPCTAHTSSPT